MATEMLEESPACVTLGQKLRARTSFTEVSSLGHQDPSAAARHPGPRCAAELSQPSEGVRYRAEGGLCWGPGAARYCGAAEPIPTEWRGRGLASHPLRCPPASQEDTGACSYTARERRATRGPASCPGAGPQQILNSRLEDHQCSEGWTRVNVLSPSTVLGGVDDSCPLFIDEGTEHMPKASQQAVGRPALRPGKGSSYQRPTVWRRKKANLRALDICTQSIRRAPRKTYKCLTDMQKDA